MRQYQEALLHAITNTLRELDFPDSAITIIIAAYGSTDTNGFWLDDIHWAEAQLLQQTRNWEEVD